MSTSPLYVWHKLSILQRMYLARACECIWSSHTTSNFAQEINKCKARVNRFVGANYKNYAPLVSSAGACCVLLSKLLFDKLAGEKSSKGDRYQRILIRLFTFSSRHILPFPIPTDSTHNRSLNRKTRKK